MLDCVLPCIANPTSIRSIGIHLFLTARCLLEPPCSNSITIQYTVGVMEREVVVKAQLTNVNSASLSTLFYLVYGLILPKCFILLSSYL